MPAKGHVLQYQNTNLITYQLIELYFQQITLTIIIYVFKHKSQNKANYL